jgi:putative ABC transport system ATP-binding protein
MIETQQLAYTHRAGPTLQFADVNLPQGGALLLRGASGAGKSTWLALVAGLRQPASGRVRVAGQDLAALAPAQRDAWRAQHVGFLPQRLHLSAALSVADNLALAFFAAGLPRDDAAIAQALAHVGLADMAGRKPHQLSGGQAQRVALARAVLLRPQVLLADEPTASLDDANATAALGLLQGSAAACGASLVIATHDQRVEAVLSAKEGLQRLFLSQIGTMP